MTPLIKSISDENHRYKAGAWGSLAQVSVSRRELMEKRALGWETMLSAIDALTDEDLFKRVTNLAPKFDKPSAHAEHVRSVSSANGATAS